MPTITKNLDRIKGAVLALFLLFFGIAISLHYGRLGFMPLDHSTMFDGGYRILSGQLPFRDFNIPNTLAPVLLQAVFFKLFGISWFVYCFHAAVFNGLFCVLVYLLLKYFGGSKIISFFYAFLSGFIYYPPVGIPIMEQHAFFFILLAIVMSVKASQASNNLARVLLWLMIPAVTTIAYFCKQNPTIFAIPVVLFTLFTMTDKPRRSKMFFYLSAGFAAILLFCLIVFKIFHLSFADFSTYYFSLPASIFHHRIAEHTHKISQDYTLIFRQDWTTHKLRLFFMFGFILALSYPVILLPKHSGKESLISNSHGDLPKFGLSLLLMLVCGVFIKFTNNQNLNGVPYIFASFGILHIIFLRAYRDRFRDSKILPFQSVIKFIFIFIALVIVTVFNIKINETRMVNDLEFNKELVQSSDDLPSELKFMAFIMPSLYKFSAKDLGELVVFLKGQKENFFLLGDTAILYGLTNKPSINPILWFHPGLTYYASGDNFRLYEDKLMDNIKKYNVGLIVIEDFIWFGGTIDSFPKLKYLVNTKGSLYKVFGGFKVIKLNR